MGGDFNASGFVRSRLASTEEQARHGDSIDAQISALREWAKSGHHIIIGEYIDAGISARKPASKRPALQRLLHDIGQVEAVVFTKLDRWFRNVREYHKVQEVLEAHGVSWKTIWEDYDTLTTDGRFKVSIMLAIAEQEADRTGDRIRAVFAYKESRGEAISGNAPVGYVYREKHLRIDESKADAVRRIFTEYADTKSVRRAAVMARSVGAEISYNAVRKLLSNETYAGRHRGKPGWCEPIIPPETFDAVQAMLTSRSVRCNQTRRTYIFSGLVVCAECGHRMNARYGQKTTGSRPEYVHYFCPKYQRERSCPHKMIHNEKTLETWLLGHVMPALEEEMENRRIRRAQRKKPAANPEEIQRKMERLADLYVDGIISREKLLRDRAALEAQLADAMSQRKEPEPDYRSMLAEIRRVRDVYDSASREERQRFWRKIVAKITVNAEGSAQITFA